MACGNQNYFAGNGPVYIRKVGDNCGDPQQGWFALGDANELMISIAQEFNTHFESLSGNRNKAARWITQTDADFTMAVQNFTAANLVVLLQGTDAGPTIAGSVVAEDVDNVYEDSVFYVQYPGISAVSLLDGATPLVENTDYVLVDNGRDGGIRILESAPNISGPGPITITCDYTHVGVEAVISALVTGPQDYQVRFNGINLTAPNTPVIVTINRAQFNATEELALIGTDLTNLSFTGAVLPDELGNFFTVTLSNEVV